MAIFRDRLEENVPGRYYVDVLCIDCDICRTLAPKNFRRHPEGGSSYVSKQPETDEEETGCRKALEECPVRAIGDDGKTASPSAP